MSTEQQENMVTDSREINNIMASMIRDEFSQNKNFKEKYPINKINPISVEELQAALRIIKTNKATSLDCSTDFIVKILCRIKKFNPEDHPEEWEFRERVEFSARFH